MLAGLPLGMLVEGVVYDESWRRQGTGLFALAGAGRATAGRARAGPGQPGPGP